MHCVLYHYSVGRLIQTRLSSESFPHYIGTFTAIVSIFPQQSLLQILFIYNNRYKQTPLHTYVMYLYVAVWVSVECRPRISKQTWGRFQLEIGKQVIRWISDQNRNRNNLANFIQLCYFYSIKIAKLCVISQLTYLGFIFHRKSTY